MGFLTGFASGALQQANRDFANQDKQYNQDMLVRQKAVDQVAQDWERYKTKMNATQDKANSYMAEFNIPKDAALSLADDPAFDKITDPNQRVEYAKSLQPTGSSVPATGPSTTQITPDKTIPGNLFMKSRTVPGVTETVPGTPARQIYQAGGVDPLYKVAQKILANPNSFQKPDGSGVDTAALAQATQAFQNKDYKSVIDLQSTRSRQLSNKNNSQKAFDKVSDLIARGALDPKDAPAVYAANGGTEPVNWSTLHRPAPQTADKVSEREQKISDIMSSNPGTTRQQAANIVDGVTKTMMNQQTGEISSVNQLNHQITPTTMAPGFENVMSKKERETAQNSVQSSLNAISGIHFALDALHGNPHAAGLPGELSEKIGGAATTLADAIGGPGAGTWVDKFTQASASNTFRTSVRTLVFELAKPLVQGTGARLTQTEINMVQGIVGGLDWHHSAQQTEVSLQNLMRANYSSTARNLYRLMPPPKDLATVQNGKIVVNNQEASNYINQLESAYGLPASDAQQLTAGLARMTVHFEPFPYLSMPLK